MKILIISHNPISTQNNMGKTFLSLFSHFEKDELCQIYISPTLPNLDRCASYYRVTDKEVVSALFRRWEKVGGEIPKDQIREEEPLYQNPEDRALYRNPKNKSPVRRMLRDAMWQLVKWYDRDLERWLEREKPECIFFAPGAAKFIYDFALRISKRLHIPIVTYICDEYYFVEPPRPLLERLRVGLFQGKMRKLMKSTAHLLVICEELKQAYCEEFSVPASVLMTGSAVEISRQPRKSEEPREICYFGNIRCNRYRSLREVGQALDEINRLRGENFKLKVYTFEQDEIFLEPLRQVPSIELCGPVTGAAFDSALRAAPLLLHVEAFDEESIDRVRHSVSTKIADSLAIGTPFLAYGPDCVSSMKHLQRHGCALSATSREQLRPMLETALFDETARYSAVEKALKTAAEYHDSDAVGRRLRSILAAQTGNA